MLIQPISVEKREGKEYEILSEDIYQVELLDVNQAERPTYETRLMPKEQQKFDLVFNFDFVLLENELRGRRIWANFIPSYFYVSKKTGKNLGGPYKTRREALKRLRQVEFFKNKGSVENSNVI